MLKVNVVSAYVAGAWCADVSLPAKRPIHLQRRNKVDLERAVYRVLRSMPRTDLIAVQWHELRSVL